MEDIKAKVAQLEDYIMKKCLWQFNSRAWDRKDQNENILTKAKQLLCGEHVVLETPADRCYWVEAVSLVEAYKSRFTWINSLNKEELTELMKSLKARIDHLTITGSLNKELTDPLY